MTTELAFRVLHRTETWPPPPTQLVPSNIIHPSATDGTTQPSARPGGPHRWDAQGLDPSRATKASPSVTTGAFTKPPKLDAKCACMYPKDNDSISYTGFFCQQAAERQR